jgi:ABC-type cobalamin/Fe3+-siderophores transport system ATPase subunit
MSANQSVIEGPMVTRSKGKLFFMCGKMAAGKSTLSKSLTAKEGGVLLVQDDLLESLYPGL